MGEVLSDRQLFRHRQRAGYRIGKYRTIDLYRYVGWLYSQRHGEFRVDGPSGYDAFKEQARSRNLSLSLSGRDIAPLPEVANLERRAAALTSFQVFCETYFAAAFTLAWSPDHVKAMAKIERAVLDGELFAHAMPRGSGNHSQSWSIHRFKAQVTCCRICLTYRRIWKIRNLTTLCAEGSQAGKWPLSGWVMLHGSCYPVLASMT